MVPAGCCMSSCRPIVTTHSCEDVGSGNPDDGASELLVTGASYGDDSPERRRAAST